MPAFQKKPVFNADLDDVERRNVAQLLGREPRGLEAVEVWNANGEPAVIRVASLVDNKPFPTLFWLIDPSTCYWLDQLEAGGTIAQLQQRIDQDEAIQAAVRADHLAYIQQRGELMRADIKAKLVQLGYYDDLQQRGVGGIADFSRIRCLHTHYAAHLVRANTIGQWLDAEFRD